MRRNRLDEIEEIQQKRLLSIQEYWADSKSGLYSVLVVLPLILGYQILIWAYDISKINAADYLLQKLFKLIGVVGMNVVSLSILIAFFVAFVYHLKNKGSIEIHTKYVIMMIIESTIYAFCMFFGVKYLLNHIQLLSITAEKVALILSSGVYEELVFRVVFISGFRRVFNLFWGNYRIFNISLAIIFSSAVFSMFHFIGPMGNAFDWMQALVIFVLGFILSLIYIFRGFGIAVYAHMFFNFIVVLTV